MIIKIFTVFDSKAEAYLPPFSFGQVGEAIRSFLDAAGAPDHKFNTHAEDYTLYHLGTFDDSQGIFELLPQPELIGRADIMRKQQQNLLAARDRVNIEEVSRDPSVNFSKEA